MNDPDVTAQTPGLHPENHPPPDTVTETIPDQIRHHTQNSLGPKISVEITTRQNPPNSGSDKNGQNSRNNAPNETPENTVHHVTVKHQPTNTHHGYQITIPTDDPDPHSLVNSQLALHLARLTSIIATDPE